MKQSGDIFVIDRFEADIAVLESIEGREILQIKRAELADGAHEGDCVFINDAGMWQVEMDKTKQRADAILEKRKRIFGR